MHFSETQSEDEDGHRKMPDLGGLGDKGLNPYDLINAQDGGPTGKYDENNMAHVKEMLDLLKSKEKDDNKVSGNRIEDLDK
jgi:hypothetical protein